MAFKGKIYYVTRTWGNNEKSNNCTLLRTHYAKLLGTLAEVVIVTPNFFSREKRIEKNTVSFPYAQERILWHQRLQKIGIEEDYLQPWAKGTINYLKTVVTEDDLVFTTSGGELASISIGDCLKRYTGCRFVINFRDPVDGSLVFGKKMPGYHGINRDYAVGKYIKEADLVITACESFQIELQKKYPEKANVIVNHYAGYTTKIPDVRRKNKAKRNIVYSGAMSEAQDAKILYRAAKGIPNIMVTYICENPEKVKAEMPESNINCISLMPHETYLAYMEKTADIGFLSLKGAYFGACVPSKLFEYINLQLPILASLPDGAAKQIVLQNHFGIACSDSDVAELTQAVQQLLKANVYKEYAECVCKHREAWYCKNRNGEFLSQIEKVWKG